LAKKIEEKQLAVEAAAIKAEQERLALEKENTDRTRVGVFGPDSKVVEANRQRKEEMNQPEDKASLDPRVGVFYRGGKKEDSSSSWSWFGWMNWKTGEQKQVEATQAKEEK
jgi:hypothetical protein